jgi:hypothetical protein
MYKNGTLNKKLIVKKEKKKKQNPAIMEEMRDKKDTHTHTHTHTK